MLGNAHPRDVERTAGNVILNYIFFITWVLYTINNIYWSFKSHFKCYTRIKWTLGTPGVLDVLPGTAGITERRKETALSDPKNYLRSTLFTFCANHKEVKLSFNEHSTGLTLQNINALLSPPNECCNMWVNLESRYGTCPSRFLANAPINNGGNKAVLQK